MINLLRRPYQPNAGNDASQRQKGHNHLRHTKAFRAVAFKVTVGRHSTRVSVTLDNVLVVDCLGDVFGEKECAGGAAEAVVKHVVCAVVYVAEDFSGNQYLKNNAKKEENSDGYCSGRNLKCLQERGDDDLQR